MADVTYNDKLERVTLGALIVGGNLAFGAILAFLPLPTTNLQLIAQVVGGFNAALGIIVANTWKTTATERQQAQTLQTMATAAAAPLTTTTTTTVEKTDGQPNGGNATAGHSGLVGPKAVEPAIPPGDTTIPTGLPDNPPDVMGQTPIGPRT